MILLPRAVRVYFATQPANLRQSFEGQAAVGADTAFALDAGLTIAHIDRVRASHLLHLIASGS